MQRKKDLLTCPPTRYEGGWNYVKQNKTQKAKEKETQKKMYFKKREKALSNDKNYICFFFQRLAFWGEKRWDKDHAKTRICHAGEVFESAWGAGKCLIE